MTAIRILWIVLVAGALGVARAGEETSVDRPRGIPTVAPASIEFADGKAGADAKAADSAKIVLHDRCCDATCERFIPYMLGDFIGQFTGGAPPAVTRP